VKLTAPRRVAAFLVGLALVGVGALLVAALWRLHLHYVNAFLGLGLGCLAIILALLIGWRLLSAFLYKVGRRLAFSYFLIGVLPIPMVMVLLGVVAYLLSSFFIGHLYRDSLRSLSDELAATTRERAALYQRSGQPPVVPAAAEPLPGTVFAYYQDGRRVAGDPRAPLVWPSWAELPAARQATAEGGGGRSPVGSPLGETDTSRRPLPRFYARSDNSPALAAAVPGGFAAGGPAAGRRGRGVLGFYAGDLDLELSRRSGLWVETNRLGDPVDGMQVKLFSRELPLLTLHRDRNEGEAQKFFKQRSKGEAFWDRQLLWCGQVTEPLLDLGTGRQIASKLLVTLNGTPRILKQHLFAANGEIDAASWGLLLALAVLLFNVYVAAAVMALFMIGGLSRAVNRLSRATDAVRRGDFSARIPVRRRDQIGVLQRTFNEMTTNLEMLVAASAQKELLDKELALARDLQTSLIPSNLPSGEGVEFATLFEPSAAIGGDYFDVLKLSDRELAVIIADVSGHGLSTGLRMAMLKAALLILIEETRQPEEILRRLDTVVRSNAEGRCFVTATLAIFDLRTGRLVLTNAGHPPTYIVRGNQVEEIALPSSPLGGLGQRYVRRELTLERGDVVVWLSDGVFEWTNAADEPFGYDRIEKALAAAPRPTGAGRRAAAAGGGGGGGGGAAAEPTAAAVRDRLLAAVAAHVGAHPPSDDRTVVVMRWGGPVAKAVETAERAAAAVA
jgi:HAMP domain-containing protein